ncbi:putative Prolamin-like domain-containing protein [Arabidopsis thaliana]
MSKFNSQITMLFIVLALCALNIIAAVFENGTMHDPCCNDLVREGKVCHDTLIKYIADKPMLIAHETEYLKKSDDL